MTPLLVVLAVVFVCAGAFWFFEIDFRWHRHIPRAPAGQWSNVRRLDYWPDPDAHVKEQLEADLPGGAT